jgi:hypothetical protein
MTALSADSCARCDAYLGDGQLRGEACEENCAVHPSRMSAAPPLTSTSTEPNSGATAVVGAGFALSDLRDVRFALPHVVVSARSVSQQGGRCASVRIQTEQVSVPMVLVHYIQLAPCADPALHVSRDLVFCRLWRGWWCT